MTNHKTLDAYTEVYDFAHFEDGLLFSNIPQSDISYYLINARKFSPEFGEVTVATLLIIKGPVYIEVCYFKLDMNFPV